MTFTIKTDYYNYFGGHKPEYKSFTNLLEGWAEYKRLKATDFDYDDAWKETTYFITHNYTVENKPQRPHARTKSEWEAMCNQKYEDEHLGFSKEVIEFLMSLYDDETDDETPII